MPVMHASLLCKCSLTGPLHISSKSLSLQVCAACSEYITSVMLHLSRVCWMPPNFFSQCTRFSESTVTCCDLYEIKKKTMIQVPKFTHPTSLACNQSPASNLTSQPADAPACLASSPAQQSWKSCCHHRLLAICLHVLTRPADMEPQPLRWLAPQQQHLSNSEHEHSQRLGRRLTC